MKKIISLILSAVMLTSFCSVCTAAEEENNYSGYAEYTFGTKPTKINIESYWIGDEQVIEKAGRKALLRTPEESQLYFTLALNRQEFAAPDGQSLVVSVDYYDEGSGCFTIAYDGVNNKQYYGHTHTNADIVRMEGTNEWKTYDFYLDDIKCVHGYDGSDMRIGLWADEMGRSSGNVYISSVRIKKTFPRIPIKQELTSSMVGNIFGPGEAKDITVSLENITEIDFDTTAEYTVYDNNGKEVLSDSFDIKMKKNAQHTKTINLDAIQTFGTYTLKTDLKSRGIVEGEEKELENSKITEFSYVNKPPKELRNPVQNVCSHGVWHGSAETAKVAGYAGFGEVRDEIIWNNVETVRGVLKVPEADDLYAQQLKAENTGYMLLLSYGNFLYDNTDPPRERIAPNTEDGFKGFANYCAYMAEKYKGYINNFEIWNEYNFTVFNERNEGPDVYAKMLEYAYKAIKEVNPDAQIAGVACAGTPMDFIEGVLENGGYEYMDALSCHPYDWTGEFRNDYFVDRLKDVQKLMRKYGEVKPIWLTEYGMNTGDSTSGVSEQEQAESALQTYALSIGEDVAQKLYWYDIQNDGADTSQESNWGLIDSNYSEITPWAAKPAYAVMAGINSLLTGAEPVGKVTADNALYAYNFKSADGKNIAVVWSMGGSQTLGLDLGCTNAEILDMYSNHIADVESADGIYNFELTSEPIYIRGNFNKFEQSKGSISQNASYFRVTSNDKFTVDFSDKSNRNLTIEADVPDGIELIENNGIKNGRGTLSFKTSETEGSYTVNVRIKDGDKLVLLSHINVDVGSPIEAEIVDYEQIRKGDDDHWRAIVRIKNTSSSYSVSGKCEPLGNKEMTKNTRTVRFFNLAPGREKLVYMNLPEMVKKRVRKLEYRITLDSGYTTEVEKQTDFTSAAYTDRKPKLDGKIDVSEWKGIWLCADEASNIKEIVDWRGPQDISYDCNLMWDEDNLYMAVIATDDAFYQNETPDMQWRGDGVQFGIEDKVYQGEAIVDGFGTNEEFTEMAIALLPSGENAYRFRAMNNTKQTGEVQNVEMKIEREDTRTIYEIAVPWSEMFYDGYKPDADKTYGFSMLVNDNDGTGRRGWAEYNDGIGSGKNAMLFGRLRLIK